MQSLARRLATAPAAHRPDRPVPVALAVTDLDVGGAERALVSLATGLDRRRWDVSVLCLGPEAELAAPLRDAGLPVTCLDVSSRRPVDAVRRLAAALRARRPSLVQGFLFHANVASRLAGRLAGVPWAVGGLRVAERRQWHLLADALTFRLSAGSVCVSEGVRRYSRDVGRLPPDRLVTIPNGVDLGAIDAATPVDRSSLGVPQGEHLALFVGRIEAQKGVNFLIDAAARLAGRPGWHLAIVGDGPDRAALRAASLPMAGRVHWLGRRGDVPGLLKAADALILPSLWEGMPNVVLEAMAAGRAVVATRVEGSEDLVVDGQTGWLVPPGDAPRLAEAWGRAIDDPGACRRLGAAGRARVAAEFTAGMACAAYDRLWSRLLGFEALGGPAAMPTLP